MARQRLLRGALMVLCVLICLSTVFLKQHSVVDVALGAALALVLDLILRQRRPESWFLFASSSPGAGGPPWTEAAIPVETPAPLSRPAQGRTFCIPALTDHDILSLISYVSTPVGKGAVIVS